MFYFDESFVWVIFDRLRRIYAKLFELWARKQNGGHAAVFLLVEISRV